MSEAEKCEFATSHDKNGNDDMEVVTAVKKFVDKLSSDEKKLITTSSKVLQNLVCKFQQLQASKVNFQDRYRQGVRLFSELIDSIEMTTTDDENDFTICRHLFLTTIAQFRSDIITKDEGLIRREIFFASLDLLSKREISLYLNDEQHVRMPQSELYKILTSQLLAIVNSNILHACFTSDDVATRKYTNTFCIISKRIERNVCHNNQAEQEASDSDLTTSDLLSFLWNLSDRTVLVPWLLNTGLANIILACLKTLKLSSKTAESIINIIQNISRHDEGVDELNKFDGLRILKDIERDNTEELDDSNNLLISMTIVNLSTVEQIRSDNKRKNRIINQLLQVTIDAAKVSLKN
ncbi:unnamed protein product [Adineta steineri]|uniref:Uncharacterized protein n=1 Tax=Adineta steineri TaxID=433720 RepID=A0A813Z3J1_9BILA|nr:unnamed protein product [Adineta steineri]CAF0893021.1 unnamed protein product [Adineta steineri]